MVHEVYICYSSNDKMTADAICHVLEENKFKCWIKPRDLGVHHIAEEITQAIRESQIMVLVFSENAKNSNYVNTEVDIAFSSKVPIVVFRIDASVLDGGLEFFLENKHWLDAYPNPALEFRNLVVDVAKLLDRPISDPVISSNIIDSMAGYAPNTPKPIPQIPNQNYQQQEGKDEGINIVRVVALMCGGPILLTIFAMLLVDSFDTLAGWLFLIAIAMFIITPIYYIAKKIYNKV